MKFRDLIDETIQYLLANKTKTVLTTLGITIGIMSIIAMLSIGNAAKKSLEKDIQSMGANILQVAPDPEFTRNGKQQIKLYTDKDLKDISKIPEVRIPYALDSATYRVTYKNNKQVLILMGSNLEFHDELNSSVDDGRDFTQEEVDNYSKVITIGPGIAKDMFGKKNPVGEYLKINGISFKIVGVNKSIKFALGIQNYDNRIFIPITSMHRYLLGRNESSFLWIQLHKDADPQIAKDKIYKILTNNRGLS